MTGPRDFVAQYVQLVMGGAEFDDPGLARLRALMSLEEGQQAKEKLIVEYIKTLPPAADSGATDMTERPDFAGLYLELVRRGGRPNDVRLAALTEAMTAGELERAKAALGELWLRAEPPPARPN
jgi:hypothetical protein